jgi:hypothetical protein
MAHGILLTIKEIEDAANVFNVGNDAHIECLEKVVYLHWVETREKVQELVDTFTECVDVLINDVWTDIYSPSEKGDKVVLPDEEYFSCRYIVATN